MYSFFASNHTEYDCITNIRIDGEIGEEPPRSSRGIMSLHQIIMINNNYVCFKMIDLTLFELN